MTYFQLIKRFALRPIRTEESRLEAVRIMLELGRKGDENLSDDEVDYMSVLATLIKSYEQEKIESESVSPAEALRYLLEINKLRRSDIKHLISEEHSSAVLSTKTASPRKISKTEAARLAAYFKVSPQLFLDKVVPFMAIKPARIKSEASESNRLKTRSAKSTREGVAVKTRAQKSSNSKLVASAKKISSKSTGAPKNR